MVAIPKLSDDLEADIVHSIINTTGRDVTITQLISRGACPLCGGSDPFCILCQGNTTVDITSSVYAKAKVKWQGSDQRLYKPEGQYPEGDCVVTLRCAADGTIVESGIQIERVTSVIVDNKKCVLDKWYYRGSPINRVYMVLKQDENGVQRVG